MKNKAFFDSQKIGQVRNDLNDRFDANIKKLDDISYLIELTKNMKYWRGTHADYFIENFEKYVDALKEDFLNLKTEINSKINNVEDSYITADKTVIQ